MNPAASTGARRRARALGLRVGRYAPGVHNAITDVAGVRVGHTTLIEGKALRARRKGGGPVRTGVTAIIPGVEDPFHERVMGGHFVLNGAGEVSGLTQVAEWGLIETPILLTNTLSVGTASHACVRWMVDRYPGIGDEHDVVIPLVGECDDSWLNDIAGHHVKAEHVVAAIEGARGGSVAEGNVGGGTGMVTCDLSGGIGTSSRRLPKGDGGYTIGVLVMSNFGHLADLRMDGIPVGALLEPELAALKKRRRAYGSIIAVAATDAPLSAHQLNRIGKRVALGIGRVGSFAAHGSGEIVLTFSTANRVPRGPRRARPFSVELLRDTQVDPLYRATVEATEEAILNAICAADTLDGVMGHVAPGLPLDRVQDIVERHYALRDDLARTPMGTPPPA
jgi:D-aminopeptidase